MRTTLPQQETDDPLNQKNYWRKQSLELTHGPQNYIHSSLKTEAFFEELLRHITLDHSFLEVGCNSGVNLNFLWQRGFRKLAGFDINEQAIHEVLPSVFPELAATGQIFSGDAIEVIKKFQSNSFDIVFAKGVLVHIPPEDHSLFVDMARVSKKFILIFEDENNPELYTHDFEHIFDSLGFEQVYYRAFLGKTDWSSFPSLDYYQAGEKKKSIRLFVRRKGLELSLAG